MDTPEIWKPVNDFYEISSIGRLKRTKPEKNTWPGRILKPAKNQRYISYGITINGKTFIRRAHILVLEAFVGKRPEGKCANHKNGNKHDNRIENLEWVTFKENSKHMIYVLGYIGEKACRAILKNENVREIRNYRGKNYLDIFSKKFGVCKSTISHIKTGRNWKHT